MIHYKNKTGVSLIELIVSLLLLGILSTGVYFLISHGRFTAATTQARGQAKQEVQLAMRYLSRDISNSRASIDYSESEAFAKVSKSLKYSDGVLNLEIPKSLNEQKEDNKITYFDNDTAQDDELFTEVVYTLQDKKLIRKHEDISRVLVSGVTDFNVDDNYDGKVQVDITVEKSVKGFYGKTVKHSESALIIIKAAEKVEATRTWRQRIEAGNY